MILISGDGASGSSYLVWLLRELGKSSCPKGYEQYFQDLPSGEPVLYELLREKRIQDAMGRNELIEWPDVIKHLGGFSYNLHQWVDSFNWKVDKVLIVTRGLEEGIRRRWAKDPQGHPINHKFLQVTYPYFQEMTSTEINERARQVVRERIGAAVLQCVERNYPFAILPFPKFVQNPKFLYSELAPVIDKSYDEFLITYNRITDLSKVVEY